MTSNTDERCCTSLDDTPMHHADGGAAPRARASAIRVHSLTPGARTRAPQVLDAALASFLRRP